MKILVPTDFSAHAMVAARYAVGFATDTKASLHFLHVAQVPGPPKARITSDMLEKNIYKADEDEMTGLMNEINTSGLPIQHQVIKGESVANVIQSYIEENAIDLVIMGSKGAGGLKKLFFGTNAVEVINKSSVPVVLVPEGAIYAGIHNIVYATDLQSLPDEIAQVLPLAKSYNAHLSIIHVCKPQTEQLTAAQNMLNLLFKELNYPKARFELITGDDSVQIIERYTYESKADLLVLFTHKINFWEQFYGKSITRELAFHNSLPLFVLNKR